MTMKINAKITMLASREGLTIEVRDNDSRVQFLNIHLTPEQFASAMGRLAETECESAEVHGLEKVGKKMEMMRLEFMVDEGPIWKTGIKEKAKEAAIKACPDGWTPNLYFGPQDSFFEKDGAVWAKTWARRWTEQEGGEK